MSAGWSAQGGGGGAQDRAEAGGAAQADAALHGGRGRGQGPGPGQARHLPGRDRGQQQAGGGWGQPGEQAIISKFLNSISTPVSDVLRGNLADN